MKISYREFWLSYDAIRLIDCRMPHARIAHYWWRQWAFGNDGVRYLEAEERDRPPNSLLAELIQGAMQ